MRRLLLSRFDAHVSILERVAILVGVRSLRLTSRLAPAFGTLDPVDPVEEVLVKVDRLTAQERGVVRAALRALVPACSRRVGGACAEARLMARIDEEARDLSVVLVRDARSRYRPTWLEIGAAFGITMQSAQWRFSRPPRKTATRLRR